MIILSLDPGPVLSAYLVLDTEDYRIIDKGKVENDKLMALVKPGYFALMGIEGFQRFGRILPSRGNIDSAAGSFQNIADTVFITEESNRLSRTGKDYAIILGKHAGRLFREVRYPRY